MLERLIEESERNLGMSGGKVEQLSGLLIALILDRRHGGFDGFASSFHQLGMQGAFASWSSIEPSHPIAFDQVKGIFGVPLIASIGGKLGIGSVMTTHALCCLLPGLIEALTLENQASLTIPGRCDTGCARGS